MHPSRSQSVAWHFCRTGVREVTHSPSLMQVSSATWQVDWSATLSSPGLPFSLAILSVGRFFVLVCCYNGINVRSISVLTWILSSVYEKLTKYVHFLTFKFKFLFEKWVSLKLLRFFIVIFIIKTKILALDCYQKHNVWVFFCPGKPILVINNLC